MEEVVTGWKKSASVFGSTEGRCGFTGACGGAPCGGALEGPLPATLHGASGLLSSPLSPDPILSECCLAHSFHGTK